MANRIVTKSQMRRRIGYLQHRLNITESVPILGVAVITALAFAAGVIVGFTSLPK